MKRVWWLAGLLFLVPLPGQESDPFLDRLVRFDKAWAAFKLEYIGCPNRPITNSDGVLQNCTGTGSLDYKKLMAAKREAMKLFRLRPEDDGPPESR